MRSLIAAVLVLVPAINAHFTVAYPPTLGAFKDDEEGNAPCGGYTPNLATDATTDFHVGGDAIGTVSTHPQSNWLYRVTTDSAGAGNWTQIYPIVQQSGLGSFCVPKVSVSDSWIGKKAVLSIVSNAPDGLLYQVRALDALPSYYRLYRVIILLTKCICSARPSALSPELAAHPERAKTCRACRPPSPPTRL